VHLEAGISQLSILHGIKKNSKIKELQTKMDMLKRNGTGMNMWCQSCGEKKKSMVGMICAKIGLKPGRMVDGENGALTEEDEVIGQSKSLRGVRICEIGTRLTERSRRLIPETW